MHAQLPDEADVLQQFLQLQIEQLIEFISLHEMISASVHSDETVSQNSISEQLIMSREVCELSELQHLNCIIESTLSGKMQNRLLNSPEQQFNISMFSVSLDQLIDFNKMKKLYMDCYDNICMILIRQS
ncbi:hypothetical protein LOZ57_002404 [Ophidiomyces ophidiicola]|uniref:uncharacterized protein n=1 Tax=Ophidiomyces ophidiicola TaxID=1387563 RepID=UPI0020C4DDDD|nr:uncharacterized protein LOZ57_002404 [Ophidiomyces ophidiicola]KAI1949923.1 hypothetical protein LOZ57_002404 [Ophidiomyces ophidiicola]